MSKAMLNMFILLLICFGLSVVPINSNLLKLNIQTSQKGTSKSTEELKSPKVEKEPVFAIVPVLPSNSTLTGPESLDFEISAANIKDSAGLIKKFIRMEIIKDGKVISSSTTDKLGATVVLNESDNTRARLKVPFNYKSLGIISGKYNAKIEVLSQNGASTDKSFSYNIIYLDNKEYASAAESRATRMNVYYADTADAIMIPISKYVSSQRSSALSLGTTLSVPLPESSGISNPVSELPKASYSLKGGALTINFDSKYITEKNLAISDNTLLLNSMIATALSSDAVQSVNLTVDDRDDITILNSKLGTHTFSKNEKSPKIYVGYTNKSNYVYLIPMSTTAATPSGIFEELASKPLPKLKKGSYFNSVPSSVKLIDSKLENGVLTLNMSKDFLTAFGADSDYLRMMIDSIVNSMSFVSGVEKVAFMTEGKPIEQIGELKLQSLYTPRLQLNPIVFSR